MCERAILIAAAATLLHVAPLWASEWTGPFNVSLDHNPTGGDFFPDMAHDSQGNLHMVWCDDAWKIRHRIKSPQGAWSGVSEVSVGQDSTYWVRCAMDRWDNLHVAWHRSTGPNISYNEVYYRKRSANGTWGTQVNISNTPSTGSIFPDIAVDSLGRVFVAWHESVNNWDVGMAMFDGSSWQAMQIVGSSPQIDAYPVLAVDASDTLHISYTWDYQEIYYRTRDAAGTWSGTVNISNASGKSQDPHLAVAPDGTPHVVWHDARMGDWEYFYATKVNGTWQTPVNLSNSPNTTDCYGAVAVSPDGSVHAVWQDYANVYYTRKAAGAPWPPAALLYTSSYSTKHAVVWVDASSDAHLAWQNKPAGAEWDVLYMMKSYPDSVPPAQVGGLTAIAGNTHTQLSWANPTDLDYVGTVVRYKTTGYPTGPSDGTLLYHQISARGSSAGFTHSGLTNGVTGYYAVFTYDDSYNYSASRSASGTPAVNADMDRDGDVDQVDFGLLQLCYSGPFTPPTAGCERSDLDGDNDADVDDATVFFGCMSGPGNYTNTNCGN